MTPGTCLPPAVPFIPESELLARLARLQAEVLAAGLDGGLVSDPVQLLYHAGTMPGGVLFVPAKGEPVLFVRRSYERARRESPLPEIVPFTSFKDVRAALREGALPCGRLGLDEHATSLAYFKLLGKYFSDTVFEDLGPALRKLRAIKSPYELEKLNRAGEVGRKVMARVPGLLVPGLSEWELVLRLFQETARLGRSCIARLAPGSGEGFMGTVCFGDSALAPSAFDGPDGMPGISPACPVGGSDRRLERGDLVLVDMLFPCDEYYVDVTRVFSLGRPAAPALEAHAVCLEVQRAVQARLRPGAVPSRIYAEVMDTVVEPRGFADGFMGYGTNQVKFLGHGVGLVVNESPVLAPKVEAPLEADMVMAVEPKKALAGIGMVGIENTFQVTPDGGVSLTGDHDEIVIV